MALKTRDGSLFYPKAQGTTQQWAHLDKNMHHIISGTSVSQSMSFQPWSSSDWALTPGWLMRAEVIQASLAIQVRLVTLCRTSSRMRGLRSTSDEKTTMILAVASTIVWTMRWMSSGELTWSLWKEYSFSSGVDYNTSLEKTGLASCDVIRITGGAELFTLGRVSEKEMQTPASSTCSLKSLMPYLP